MTTPPDPLTAPRNIRILNDQRTFGAVLVSASPAHDIAVLRMPVPLNPPTPLPVRSSHDLQVG